MRECVIVIVGGKPGLLLFLAPRKNQHCLDCCDAHSTSELIHKRTLIGGFCT